MLSDAGATIRTMSRHASAERRRLASAAAVVVPTSRLPIGLGRGYLPLSTSPGPPQCRSQRAQGVLARGPQLLQFPRPPQLRSHQLLSCRPVHSLASCLGLGKVTRSGTGNCSIKNKYHKLCSYPPVRWVGGAWGRGRPRYSPAFSPSSPPGLSRSPYPPCCPCS